MAQWPNIIRLWYKFGAKTNYGQNSSEADSSVSTSWRRAKFISRRNVDSFLTKLYMRVTGFYIFAVFPVSRVKYLDKLSSKYKSEDEFWRIICLDILRGRQETLRKYRKQSLSYGTSAKKSFTFRLDINLARLEDVLTDESAGELSVWRIIRLDG